MEVMRYSALNTVMWLKYARNNIRFLPGTAIYVNKNNSIAYVHVKLYSYVTLDHTLSANNYGRLCWPTLSMNHEG